MKLVPLEKKERRRSAMGSLMGASRLEEGKEMGRG